MVSLGSPLIGARRADLWQENTHSRLQNVPGAAASHRFRRPMLTLSTATRPVRAVRKLAKAGHDLVEASPSQHIDDNPMKSAPRPTQCHLRATHAAHPRNPLLHFGRPPPGAGPCKLSVARVVLELARRALVRSISLVMLSISRGFDTGVDLEPLLK